MEHALKGLDQAMEAKPCDGVRRDDELEQRRKLVARSSQHSQALAAEAYVGSVSPHPGTKQADQGRHDVGFAEEVRIDSALPHPGMKRVEQPDRAARAYQKPAVHAGSPEIEAVVGSARLQ